VKIRVDTREQRPLDFSEVDDKITTSTGTIKTFDYALEGDHESFAIERKSLPDFVGSVVMKDHYRRELDKVRRAKECGMVRLYYVIEAAFKDVCNFDFSRFKSGRVHKKFIYKRWREMSHDHGIHIVWADDELGAANAIYLLLKSRAEELKRQEED